jgi:hypothetical protein
MAKSVMDQFLEGVGNAINDIREKAVEEAYFGRVVTDNVPAPEVAAEPAQAPGSWQQYVEAARDRANRDEMPPPEPGIDR